MNTLASSTTRVMEPQQHFSFSLFDDNTQQHLQLPAFEHQPLFTLLAGGWNDVARWNLSGNSFPSAQPIICLPD